MTFLDIMFVISVFVLVVISVFCHIYTLYDLYKRDDIKSFKDLFNKRY